jgi:muramidase (phage lysozyme)
LGRFFAIDPLAKKYPHNGPYNFSENRVIDSGELEGLESFYAADGTFLGQVGESTKVMVLNAKTIEYQGGMKSVQGNLKQIHNAITNPEVQKVHQEAGLKHLNWYIGKSKDIGMTNEELNVRAFMSATSNAENHGNGELPYNASNGFTKGKLNLFTNDSYESNPEAYSNHPEDDGGPAGKFQIRRSTFNGYTKLLNLDGTFSPKNQDKIFIGIANYSNALGDIQNGNIENAVNKMAGTVGGKIEQFASFPGASDPGVTMEEFKKNFQKAIKKELNGESQIATPKGKLGI